MKCYFENGKPKIEITVVSLDNKVEIQALIDTGFNGALMLSLPDALQIGLRLINIVPVELADGTIRKEFVFEGKVELDGETLPAHVMLTPGDDSLLGTALLKGHSMNIDFSSEEISLSPNAPKK